MSDPAKAAGRPRRASHVSSELPDAGVDGIDACTARVEECVGEATGGGTDVDGDSGDKFQRELAAGVCKLERVSERFGPLEQLDGGAGPHEGIGVRDCATVEYAARRDERRGIIEAGMSERKQRRERDERRALSGGHRGSPSLGPMGAEQEGGPRSDPAPARGRDGMPDPSETPASLPARDRGGWSWE